VESLPRSGRHRRTGARVAPQGADLGRSEVPSDFSNLLVAAGAHPRHADDLQLFGQFVGTWLVTVRTREGPHAAVVERMGLWTFGWILDGRAVQNVLTFPDLESGLRDQPGERCIGTHIHYYNPQLGTWQVVGIGALSGHLHLLTAKVVEGEIRFEGRDPDGTRFRRAFSEITRDRFRWSEAVSRDSGESWDIVVEIIAIRYDAPPR
jgi:hypothetical protein